MKKIKISKGFKIGVSLFETGVKYSFFENDELKQEFVSSKPPNELGIQTTIGKMVKSYINHDNTRNQDYINKKYTEIMFKLDRKYKSLIKKSKQKAEAKIKSEEEDLQSKIENSRFFFDNIENPLHFIACLTDWFCAGERLNTTLAFVVYASQIVLNKPISLVGLGESASGKSHIFNTALSFMPSDMVLKDKKPTFASMINRSKINPYFYDGKIVFLGDMGGNEDLSEAEECLNILKELQTDGEISSSKNVQEHGDWVPKDFVLKGKPCLSYTTVPSVNSKSGGGLFDNQELSRMIILTPKTDNLVSFEKMTKSLELKGKSYQMKLEYENIAKQIPYWLLSLKKEFKEVEVINPYKSILMEFLRNSEYYKRDLEKYNDLLKIITVLNSYKNHQVETDDGKIILTSKNDLFIFKTILTDYLGNISLNLTPQAYSVFKELEECLNYENDDGTTVNEFYSQNEDQKMSKQSIRHCFSELNRKGLLQIDGKGSDNRSNVYKLNYFKLNHQLNFRSLNKEELEFISYERGEKVVEILKNEENVELNILTQHSEVEKPIWQEYEE